MNRISHDSAGPSEAWRNLPRRVHRFLLPDDPDIGWTPYLWLTYLTIIFIPWAFYSPDAHEVTVTLCGVAVFLVTYFRGFRATQRGLWFYVGSLVALGLILSPVLKTNSVYFIYAIAFLGHLRQVRQGVLAMLSIHALVIIEYLLFDLGIEFLLPPLMFGTIVGAVNMYYAQQARERSELKLSLDEVRHLATMSERERIARDLHDLLGHSLSVITLKSDLARRLMERDPQRAARELDELAQTSRLALSEVRQAVGGYRHADLNGELANARLALEAAGVRLEYDNPLTALPEEISNTLSMCVREGVTNVIRHANAERCWITLNADSRFIWLSIRDDGRGFDGTEGNGLCGMRERLSAINGELAQARSDHGTHWQIRVRRPPGQRLAEG